MPTPEQLEARRLAKNAAQRAWVLRNPEKRKATANAATKAWKLANPEVIKAWKLANPKYHAKYIAARKQADPLFKLQCALRSLATSSFLHGGWGKTTKTQALLGCTFEELTAHLQSKFKEGMTLENHGDWHLDHIKPCATATSAEELAALFHFTNLQPLWATENLSKGCKYHE